MLRLLVPIDGSDNALRAVEHVIALAAQLKAVEVQLVTVRDALASLEVKRFWTPEQIHAYQQESGEAALRAARERLDRAGIPYAASIAVGEIAPTIAKQAQESGCDMIVMGTRGMGVIGSVVLGSVANKVVHLASVPVTLVK